MANGIQEGGKISVAARNQVASCGAQFEPKNGDNFQKSSINLLNVMFMRNVILQSNWTFNWIKKQI